MQIEVLGRNTLLGAALLALSGALMAAPAAANHRQAARLEKDIQKDAKQVRRHALKFEKISNQSTASWKVYDRQWNLIDPFVEDMHLKLGRLESMKAQLTPAGRKAVQNSETTVSQIRGEMARLHNLMNRPNVNLASRRFKTDSRKLAKDARQVSTAMNQANTSA